jgi:hypothetical protein
MQYAVTLCASGAVSNQKVNWPSDGVIVSAHTATVASGDFSLSSDSSLASASWGAPGFTGVRDGLYLFIRSGLFYTGLSIPISTEIPAWFSSNGAGRCVIIIDNLAELLS